MNLVQITPGAGAMYCGGCLRDNALVSELRKAGHEVTMVPVYLPLTLDEANESAGTPIFFGGISVFLEQSLPVFRYAPQWLRRQVASPRLLQWAGRRAAGTRPDKLGKLTLSMLRGEDGRQSNDLKELLAWLKTQPQPDAVLLSNSLLGGMLRRLRSELRAPVVCMLQGEDWFLDALPESHRRQCWEEVSARAKEADALMAPSRYYADYMARRLGLGRRTIHVVHNGIKLDGYASAPAIGPVGSGGTGTPVLGYFARMCKEKGLDLLVEAYIKLRRKDWNRPLKFKVGGSCGPGDTFFVESMRGRLREAGVLQDVEFHPNLDRAAKVAFYQSLSLFSVPAVYGEAFGLYVVEALAAGVPVVLPRSGAFPELVETTGGGVICEPQDAQSLADALQRLLDAPDRARELGRAGYESVRREFTAALMAAGVARVCASCRPERPDQAVTTRSEPMGSVAPSPGSVK